MATRFRLNFEQIFGTSAQVLAGGTLTFCISHGAPDQLQAIYSDDALTVTKLNPVTLDSAGKHGDIFLAPADYRVIVKDAAGIVQPGGDVDPVHGVVDAGDVMFIQSGTGAVSRTGLDKLRESVSVKDFGAKGDGVTDDAAAFTAALAAADEISVPDGTYILNTAIEVTDGKKLRLSVGAALLRPTSATATTPVVYVIGIGAELEGGTIITEQASPNGVVCLGHKSQTDNRNAWWWRFQNCKVSGSNAAGSIGVNVPSGQVTNPSVANYFGLIQNINIVSADIGLLFSEFANAHNVSNIQYWDCRTACLELRGAYANNVVGQFMHAGAANNLVGIKISNATVGGQESTLNNVLGFTVETGGATDAALVIASNATKNTVIGNDNVAGGWFVNNIDNLVILRGVGRNCAGMGMESADIYQKLTIHNTRAGARESFDENNNTVAGVVANGTLTLKTKVAAGILIIRNSSDGATALVMVDSIGGATVINGGGFAVVGADPGVGANKLWVVSDGTSTRIINRYGTSKQIDVRTVAAAAT